MWLSSGGNTIEPQYERPETTFVTNPRSLKTHCFD